MFTQLLFISLMVGSAAITAALIKPVRRLAMTHALDVPTSRSSHHTPIPRGGGVAFSLAWILALMGLYVFGLLSGEQILGMGVGAFVVAGLGLWDDIRSLSVGVRIVVQTAAVLWTVLWIGAPEFMGLGSPAAAESVVSTIVCSVALLWMINLYNFMDGIDGLAAVEAITAGGFVALVLFVAGNAGLALAAGALAASVVGFLKWNLEPASIFMGDAGSGLLGYAFGSIALAADSAGAVPFALALLPFGVFIADATITLTGRALRGERVYEAHKSHFYQQLVLGGWSHTGVVTLVALLNVVLGSLALLILLYPALILPGLVTAVSVLGLAGVLALRSRGRSSAA